MNKFIAILASVLFLQSIEVNIVGVFSGAAVIMVVVELLEELIASNKNKIK